MTTSTALVPSRHTFEPTSADEAFALATRLVASKLLPKAVTSPEAAFAIILAGRELGVSALASLRGINVIDGKTVLASDLMLALVKRSEHTEYFRLVESTKERATYETTRRGDPEPTRMTFTIEQAATAQLLGKDNWKKYPDAMLRARCVAALARTVYPDVFLGVYDEDEIDAPALPPRPRDAVRAAPQRVTVTATKVPDEPKATPASVIEKERPAPQAPPDDALAAAFVECIAAATSYDDLAVVGRNISARKRSLSNDALIELQRMYLARKEELGGAPPPPPKDYSMSTPGAPHDEPPQPEAA